MKPADIDEDYVSCPVPKTHRRLVEAHVLWHQALATYQDVDSFRANLNALIQALRNVTFILQSEKHSVADFDDWYRARMASTPILTWVKDARNTVVKQGDLEMESSAVVRLLTWRDDVLSTISIPPSTPTELVLRNVPVLELAQKLGTPDGDLDRAAIGVERRWSAPGLDGRELLTALSDAYGRLSELVLDVHLHVGNTSCIRTKSSHPHFISKRHPSGTLACMVLGVRERTQRFQLSTGEEFVQANSAVPSVRPEDAAKRYGFAEEDALRRWQQGDPVAFAERIDYMAKRMLKKDKSLQRFIFLRDADGNWNSIPIDAKDATEKHILLRMVAELIEATGADALVDVNEVWMIDQESMHELARHRIDEAPSRREAIEVLVATRDGVLRSYTTPFTRGPFGGIRLGDTSVDEKRQAYYLAPIIDVWRRHGTQTNADGRRFRRLWEPDPLDCCYCGAAKQYAQCCKNQIDAGAARTPTDKILSALADGRFGDAEVAARARLAQYVIWVRQHTTPTRHSANDLHRKLLELDIAALDAHVRLLHSVFVAIGRHDGVVEELEAIGRVIAIPEVHMRLTAIATQWLLAEGDVPGATDQIKSLGPPATFIDVSAAILASRIMPWSDTEKALALQTAISAAATKEERWQARLELGQILARSGSPSEALSHADVVATETRTLSEHQDTLAEALFLRWELTDDEEAFRTAVSVLDSSSDHAQRHRLGSMLLAHGDFSEAEKALQEQLAAGDPVAQLLVVEARTFGGRLDEAKQLLWAIPAERIAGRLRFAYAIASANVALLTDHEDLKKSALEYLKGLQMDSSQAGPLGEFDETFRGLEEALRGEEKPSRFIGHFLGKIWPGRRNVP